jgi:hypothetical protein
LTSAARACLLAAGAAAFAVAATANAGGYRYGASDQAFYIPAIRKAMDPSLFPRDGWLLAAQGNVILWDGLVAGLSALLHAPLPWVFFMLYVAGILGLYAAGVYAGWAAGASVWGTAALLAMLTLRHRIAKTGVNTLEGYLHPRMIAFAFGMFAIGAFLRRRPGWALASLVAAVALHPTTGVWFGMLLAAAAFAAWPRWRRPLALLGLAAAAVSVWAIAGGPLSSRAVLMDEMWLTAVATKDYLFPHEWPLYAWLLNLLPAVIAAAVLWKARGTSLDLRGLLWGALGLTAFFVVTLPFVAMRYALAVQMQIPRVFWLVELVALLALVSLASSAKGVALDRGRARRRLRAAPILAALFWGLSLARGGAVLFGEKDGRLITIDLPPNDWTGAMTWLRQQPVDAHVLADPGHAWRYGSSVRVAAERDVFHEDVKDAALAMYDRDVAARVVERRGLTQAFPDASPETLRALGHAFDLDYLVTERHLDMPVAYENATFRIYSLRRER